MVTMVYYVKSVILIYLINSYVSTHRNTSGFQLFWYAS